MKRLNMAKFLVIVLLSLLMSSYCQAASLTPSDIINESIEALKEMSGAEDNGAFKALLKEAKGIAIFPSLLKVGWGIGGQYGRGIIFRKGSTLDLWYGPAFAKMKSISIGPQIGVQSVALVLVIYNDRGMEGFTETNFTLGGSASIAAGPLGRSLSADTDYKFKASIYSYSISKGAYIGASFQGSTIEEDREMNELFYNKSVTNRNLLDKKISLNPSVIKLLILLNKLSF